MPSAAATSVLARLPRVALPQGVEVQFSSEGLDLVDRVAELIGAAEHEVLISQYAITDVRILEAIRDAAQRGILVAVLLDRDPSLRNYETPRFLRQLGIPVIEARRGSDGEGWHNQRYVLIDREAVVITSCDLTTSARHNAENLLLLRLPSVVARYYNCWLDESTAGERMP